MQARLRLRTSAHALLPLCNWRLAKLGCVLPGGVSGLQRDLGQRVFLTIGPGSPSRVTGPATTVIFAESAPVPSGRRPVPTGKTEISPYNNYCMVASDSRRALSG